MTLISKDYAPEHGIAEFELYSKKPYNLILSPNFGSRFGDPSPHPNHLYNRRFGTYKHGLMIDAEGIETRNVLAMNITFEPSNLPKFSYNGIDKPIITETYNKETKLIDVSYFFIEKSGIVTISNESHPEVYRQMKSIYDKALEEKQYGASIMSVFELIQKRAYHATTEETVDAQQQNSDIRQAQKNRTADNYCYECRRNISTCICD